MKILFITIYPSPYRVDFFNELGKNDDVQLTVAFLENISEQHHRSGKWFNERYNYFKAFFLNKRIKLPKGKYISPDIIKILRNEYDEIVFGGYSYPTMIYAMWYLHRKHIAYSIEVDGGFISNDNWLLLKLKRKLISSASKWFSSGKETDKYLIYYGANMDHIVHYPFSSLNKKDIDEAMTTRWNKSLLKKQLHLDEKIIIISIGQFIYRKGFDVLLEAAKNVSREIGFYFIGGEPTEDYLSFVQNNRLDNIHFVGFKEKAELKKYYSAADVFVLPTREDIWGLVINEAMAFGLPVITTDKCIAGLELVEEGKNGYIVKSNDPSGLANAINHIITANISEMGDYSRKIISRYTIENMAIIHYQTFADDQERLNEQHKKEL